MACEGKQAKISIYNADTFAPHDVHKLRIRGIAWIEVPDQINRVSGEGKSKKFEFKYNHDALSITAQTKNIADYYRYSRITIELQSTEAAALGDLVTITESNMGTINGRIVSRTMKPHEPIRYIIESISDYDSVEYTELINKASDKMNNILAIPPDLSAPTIPTITNAVTLSNGKIQVTFNASQDSESGVYFYNIYRCQSISQTGTQDTPVVIYTIPHDGNGQYTFIDQSNENKKWYFYTITAVDKANNESNHSTERGVQAVVTASPESPYLIKAEAISDGVNISLFLYGDTSIFEDAITSSTFFRLQVSMTNGVTWTDVGKFQGNTYLWRWPDTFTISPVTINTLKFRAFSWNMYNIESFIPIEMMNQRVKFDAALLPPPYQPTEELFTQLAASQSSPGTKKVTLAKGWYRFIIKAAGGGGGGSGGGGGGGHAWGQLFGKLLGKDGKDGTRGEDGKDGGDSLVIITKDNTTITAKGGLAGIGGDSGSGGYPDEDGSDGQPGTDGQDGGYVEKLIFIAERTEITLVAGEAGLGGKEGTGGRAG